MEVQRELSNYIDVSYGIQMSQDILKFVNGVRKTIKEEAFLNSVDALDWMNETDDPRVKNLEALDLTGQGLEILSAQIYKLENLRILILGNNQFEEIPESIFALENLEFLNLRNNKKPARFNQYIERIKN